MSITKTIHQLWIAADARAELPADLVRNVEAWTRWHPEFGHRLWTEDDLTGLFREFHGLPVLDAVRACRFLAMQADVIRLGLLYEFGGWWSDLKNLPLKRFLDIVVQPGDELVLAEHPPHPGRRDPTGHIGNQLIGASPGHPFMLAALTEAVEIIAARRTEYGLVGVAGNEMLRRVLRRHETQGQPIPHRVLGHREIWGVCVKRTSASYHKVRGHWSQQQWREPMYLDECDDTTNRRQSGA
jgi:mannosyltransferase OCH1-like enzyme